MDDVENYLHANKYVLTMLQCINEKKSGKEKKTQCGTRTRATEATTVWHGEDRVHITFFISRSTGGVFKLIHYTGL